MKKLTKILAVLLACITVFSSASMAAEGNTAEEITTAVSEEITTTTVQEETTTEAYEETTAADKEETTTEAQEETTTEASEETTTEAQEETTTETQEETTTEIQEETTTEASEETTTTPDETTTTPDTSDPDVTDPTEPTQPEITSPAVPQNIRASFNESGVQSTIEWDAVENADGYTFYKLISSDNWKTVKDLTETVFVTTGHRYNSEYTYAVRAYILSGSEKIYSDDKAEVFIKTPTTPPAPEFTVENSGDGVNITYTQGDAINGFRIYVKSGSEWKTIRSVASSKNVGQTHKFFYNDLTDGKTYTFAVRTYSSGTKGAKWSPRATRKITFKDSTKATITSKEATASSVTLKWTEVEGASGYRVYVYKDKWSYHKGIKTNTYKVTGLEASTKYKFKVRAYYKVDGKTKWGSYSDVVSVTTKSSTVKAYRLKNLQKYFTDGDWCIKLYNLLGSDSNKFDIVMAGKGTDLFVRYVYENETIEYLCKVDKYGDYVSYLMSPADKEYMVLPEEESYYIAYTLYTFAEVLKIDNLSKVTAKKTTYKGKSAVAEIYTDDQLGIKKTYYFINDKLSGVKIVYADGTTESFKSIKITDTPSASVFKIPSGYKKVTY